MRTRQRIDSSICEFLPRNSTAATNKAVPNEIKTICDSTEPVSAENLFGSCEDEGFFKEKSYLRKDLAMLAYVDGDTGLYNSLTFMQNIKNIAVNQENWQCLICFDIVGTRQLNSIYGWEAVDHLLREISTWISGREYNDSILYRIDGDCFCLWVQNSSRIRTRAIAQDIQQRFHNAWNVLLCDEDLWIYCDISICEIPLTHEALCSNILDLMDCTLALSKERNNIVSLFHT